MKTIFNPFTAQFELIPTEAQPMIKRVIDTVFTVRDGMVALHRNTQITSTGSLDVEGDGEFLVL